MTRKLCLILVSLILPVSVGCQKSQAPVARLEVEPRILTLAAIGGKLARKDQRKETQPSRPPLTNTPASIFACSACTG